MTSVDDAIFLMDDEVIDNINTDIKTTQRPKINKKELHKESSIVIAKSPPIDIIKPIINNSDVEYYPSSPCTSKIIVPATL